MNKTKSLDQACFVLRSPPFFFKAPFVLVLTLFIFKAPNYVLSRTLTERVVPIFFCFQSALHELHDTQTRFRVCNGRLSAVCGETLVVKIKICIIDDASMFDVDLQKDPAYYCGQESCFEQDESSRRTLPLPGPNTMSAICVEHSCVSS